MNLLEMETIVNFNEGEEEAEIYTHNLRLKNRLLRYVEEHPDLASQTGPETFIVPKKLLSITVRAPLSDEERQRRSQAVRDNPVLPHIKQKADAGEA